MRDPVVSLLASLERDQGGVAVVVCPDLGTRDWLVDEVDSLAARDADPLRVSDVDQALTAADRLVLLVPNDERTTVLDLDGSRDQLCNPDHRRTQPLVLFLTRSGDGLRALRGEAFSLL